MALPRTPGPAKASTDEDPNGCCIYFKKAWSTFLQNQGRKRCIVIQHFNCWSGGEIRVYASPVAVWVVLVVLLLKQ